MYFLQQVYRCMSPGVGASCLAVFEDIEGAAQLARSPVTKSKSKHMNVRHFFLRRQVIN